MNGETRYTRIILHYNNYYTMNIVQRPITIIATEDRAELLVSLQSKLSQLLWSSDMAIQTQSVPYTFFANGECKIELLNTVRWHHVFVLSDVNSDAVSYHNDPQWYHPSLNDRKEYTEQLLDVANKYGAETINVISTCFPYARQDKPNHIGNQENGVRKPSWARKVVRAYESLWVKNCITFDIHNPAAWEIFERTKFIDLWIWWMINEVIEKEWLSPDMTTLSGTDEWSYKKLSSVAKDLCTKTTVTFKKRDYSQSGDVEEIMVYGEVEGRDIVVYDDMVDTGSTLVKLLQNLHTMNPRKVIVVATHGMFNKNAYELIENTLSQWWLDKIYVTDTIYRSCQKDYIQRLDISTILANTIWSLFTYTGVHHNNNATIV